jgi:hypothetical protein
MAGGGDVVGECRQCVRGIVGDIIDLQASISALQALNAVLRFELIAFGAYRKLHYSR